MRNNFVTDHFNRSYRTQLTECLLERIQHKLAKQKFKNCELVTGHTAEKNECSKIQKWASFLWKCWQKDFFSTDSPD